MINKLPPAPRQGLADWYASFRARQPGARPTPVAGAPNTTPYRPAAPGPASMTTPTVARPPSPPMGTPSPQAPAYGVRAQQATAPVYSYPRTPGGPEPDRAAAPSPPPPNMQAQMLGGQVHRAPVELPPPPGPPPGGFVNPMPRAGPSGPSPGPPNPLAIAQLAQLPATPAPPAPLEPPGLSTPQPPLGGPTSHEAVTPGYAPFQPWNGSYGTYGLPTNKIPPEMGVTHYAAMFRDAFTRGDVGMAEALMPFLQGAGANMDSFYQALARLSPPPAAGPPAGGGTGSGYTPTMRRDVNPGQPAYTAPQMAR